MAEQFKDVWKGKPKQQVCSLIGCGLPAAWIIQVSKEDVGVAFVTFDGIVTVYSCPDHIQAWRNTYPGARITATCEA